VNAHKEAQRFLDQLREQTRAALGVTSDRIPPAVVKDLIDRMLRDSLTPEDARDPDVRATLERMGALAVQGHYDDMTFDQLAKKQDNIEKAAAACIKEGLDLGHRPLVSELRTGQLNAVSMRVPRSKAYLV
jgi:hypothetical protein